MGFKMNFNKEDISGKPPVPPGWYTIQLKGFKPKVAGENKDSLTLNPEMAIVGNQEFENRRVFNNLSSKAGWIMLDFHHGFGVPMEVVQDGNEGTEAEQYTMAGTFEKINEFPDDPSQWGKYIGPLTNKTASVELAIAVRWRCCFIYSNGDRCPAVAKWRLHFNLYDPFNYTDVCETHKVEYQYFSWRQDLEPWQGKPKTLQGE